MVPASSRLALTTIAATFFAVLAFPSPALAQKGGGGMGGNNGANPGNGYRPDQNKKLLTGDEVQQAAQNLFAGSSETQTAELEGLGRITYKAIPVNLDDVLKQLGQTLKDRLPSGTDPSVSMGQYRQQVVDGMNAYLTEPEGWKFEALDDLKWKSKKVAKGEYKLSLVTDGERIVMLVLTQAPPAVAEGKKPARAPEPLRVSFKKEKAEKTPFAKLKLEIKGITDKKTEKVSSFDVRAEAMSTPSKSSDPFKAEPPKEEKKEEPKKDEAPKADEPKKGE
jgi:hypothetical protein